MVRNDYQKRRPLFYLCLIVAVMAILFYNWPRTPATVVVIDAIIKERSIVGHSLTLSLTIRTGTAAINAAEVYLTFDKTKIRIESVSSESSIFSFWVPGQPKFSNEQGEVSFIGGRANPGFVGEGRIGSVTITPLSPGRQIINFAPTTQALLNDGLGTAMPLITSPITFTTYPR